MKIVKGYTFQSFHGESAVGSTNTETLTKVTGTMVNRMGTAEKYIKKANYTKANGKMTSLTEQENTNHLQAQ